MPWSIAADGFYDYTPSLASGPAGILTIIYYVSDSTGDNSKDGLSIANAKKTISNSSTFTVSTASASAGATYQDSVSGQTFVVTNDLVSGTTLRTARAGGSSTAPGTLNKIGGTGDAFISYSVKTDQTGAMAALQAASGGSHTANTFWMLFKRGDSFHGQRFGLNNDDGLDVSGSSAAEPLLFGCYDPSFTMTTTGWGTHAIVNPQASTLARPLMDKPAGSSMCFSGGAGSFTLNSGGNNIVMVGIEFLEDGNGTFHLVNPTTFFRWEDCKFHSSWTSGQALFSAGGNGQHFHRTIHVDGGAILTGGHSLVKIPPEPFESGSYTSIFTDCYFDSTGNPSDPLVTRGHSLYLSAETVDRWAGDATAGDTGQHFVRNTIVSRDVSSSVQFRAGGIMDNCLFVRCAGAVTNGAIVAGRTSYMRNNVIIHATDWTSIGSLDGSCFDFVTGYQGYSFCTGTQVIDNNIIANEQDDCGDCITLKAGTRHASFTNNIVYKHCASNQANAYKNHTGPDGCVAPGTITGGAGYTAAASYSVSARNVIGYNGTNIAKITVTPAMGTNWPWGGDGTDPNTADHNGTGHVYVDGFTGDWANLNGRVFKALREFGTENITLAGAIPTANTTTGGGTVWFPYTGMHVRLVSNPTDATHVVGGDIIVAGGAVVHVHLAGSEVGGAYPGEPGHNFTVGDALTTTQTGSADNIIPKPSGGATWQFTVGEIESVSPTSATLNAIDAFGNLIDPNGSYIDAHSVTYIAPNRTIATYMDVITGTGGHTINDFDTAWRLQSRQFWNPLLEAKSFNDYKRQGMGKTMLGSAYADGFTPPDTGQILMPQICM